MFMVDFGWFSCLCKYTGPFGSVPMDLIFWVRFDEQIPFSSGPTTRPQVITSKCFSFIPLEVGFFRIFRFFCGSQKLDHDNDFLTYKKWGKCSLLPTYNNISNKWWNFWWTSRVSRLISYNLLYTFSTPVN